MKIYFAGRHVRKTHQFMLDKKANILYSYHELTMSPFSKEEIKNIDDLRKVKNEGILLSRRNG
jgi:hypothetical protein